MRPGTTPECVTACILQGFEIMLHFLWNTDSFYIHCVFLTSVISNEVRCYCPVHGAILGYV